MSNVKKRHRKQKKEWPAFVNVAELKPVSPKIFIIPERCKECELCIIYCPEQILEKSHEINEKGYHPPKLKDGKTFDDCADCRFCALICPEFAIYITKPEESEEQEDDS